MIVPAPVRRVRTWIALPSGRFLLGIITADAAAEQIFPRAGIRGGAGHNQATRDAIVNAAASGQLYPAYLPGTGDCAGVQGGAPIAISAIAGQAGQFMLKAGAASGNPIILGVGAATELASMIFGAIFAHHRAAVAKERSVLCAAVPAANDTLQVVDQAVQSGKFSPQDGINALTAMLGQFGQQVSSIQHGADPTSSGECNAACFMLSELRAIVLRKTSGYQDLAAAQAAQVAAAPVGAAVSSAVQSVSQALSTVSGSSLLPWAAAGLGLFLLLRKG